MINDTLSRPVIDGVRADVEIFDRIVGAGNPVHELEVRHAWANGVYIKQMALREVGWTVMQHKHKFDHITLVGAGAVAVKCDGVVHYYEAPSLINIKADTKHQIMAIKPNTVCYCIHALGADEDIETLIKE
jgi:hypothetical protein